jgi:ABC-type multidrug transport system fused ATPase/permease subunit
VPEETTSLAEEDVSGLTRVNTATTVRTNETLAEDVEESNSQGHPIWSYMQYAGPLGWTMTTILLLIAKVVAMVATYALKLMADETSTTGAVKDLVLFVILSIMQTAIFFAFILMLYRLCILPAAAKLHQSLVIGVLSRRMEFFETKPIGEILNLFTNDIARIDGSLSGSLLSLCAQYSNIILTCGLLIILSPSSVLFVAPLLVLCFQLQKFYIEKLRELRHLDAQSRSPLINYLQEADAGRLLFNVHNLSKARTNTFQHMIETNLRALFPLVCIDTWLGLRLELISVTLQVLAVGVLIVAVDLNTTGFTMTYVFQITDVLSRIAKISARFEGDVVSIARINKHTASTKPETTPTKNSGSHADQIEGGIMRSSGNSTTTAPVSSWPEEGRIEFRSVSAKYRSGLPLSLKSVDFAILPGEKVAVVGRTGAGKSSTILCLLAMMQRTSGQVLIDGVDVMAVDPVKLRRSLALMPQNPAIFSNSLRSNLDPLGLHSDDKIEDALQRSKGMRAVEKLMKHIEQKEERLPLCFLDIEIDAA